ncbi:MAG: hypothetical protein OIF51_17295 [Cellvibrionaceae bacterium]|nr:hypothetical protein [Cellvibrionaceae bacterium]
MKPLLRAQTFPQFCTQVFLCRWDRALVNTGVLFLIALGFVKGGKFVGILMGPPSMAADIATALIVTLAVLFIGYAEKQKIENSPDLD